MGVSAFEFCAAFLLGKKNNTINQPTKDDPHRTTPSREEVIADRAGGCRYNVQLKIESAEARHPVTSASRAQAANEFVSCRADEATPVACGDDAIVVRGFSKNEFTDEANVTRDRKESWFRFMDWT
ncbi:hypothetical protein BKD09_42600 [Bradyrhizobium japonicum]|uniref:Uncharacterized protein n=1 Tax=Bradyrhizobium japonicum TaxID=375 RepID=A0A1L3FP08_BRAJP|nr:hypothetical protein BKD09_42600 [Bradyrhizobium japonicum]